MLTDRSTDSTVLSKSVGKSYFNIFYTNCQGLKNKLNKIKTVTSLYECPVLCLTETHLHPDILDAEIYIENYKAYREDCTVGKEGGGSIIYVHNTVSSSIIDTFKAPDSLAVHISLPVCSFTLVCVYRSQSLTEKENYKIIQQIDKLKVPDNEELIVVGDFNLPNVNWDAGIVSCPVDTIDSRFLVQKSFMDFFPAIGLQWCLGNGTVTRRRMVAGKLQESLLDQVLVTNGSLVASVDIKAPIGKSDHVGLLCNLKIANDIDYINTTKENWSKFTVKSIQEIGMDIDWAYKSDIGTVEQMWGELYDKLMLISKNVPKINIKSTKSGTVISKTPWDCTSLKRQRKMKDKAWSDFNISPTESNLHQALLLQEKFESKECKAMVNYENKIVANMKGNPKRFFSYLKSKEKLNKQLLL